jgi:hypothetical protein
MQNELKEPMSEDYAQGFLASVRNDMKLKRNDAAIAALKARLTSSGG